MTDQTNGELRIGCHYHNYPKPPSTRTTMQDTKNLIKKRDKYIPNRIKEAEAMMDINAVEFWKRELKSVSDKINLRNKNRKKFNS